MKLFRKKMNTRFITFLLAVCCVAALIGVAMPQAVASQLDVTKPCSITVSTPDEYPELVDYDFDVYVWRVATVDNSLNYTLTEKFSTGVKIQGYDLKDLNEYKMSAETTDLNKVKELSEALYNKVMGKEDSKDPNAPEGNSENGKVPEDYIFHVENGKGTLKEGKDGKPIPAGYYLIVPQDVYGDEYVYTYGPTLVSVPHMDYITPEQGSTEEQTTGSTEPYQDWVYDVIAKLKPEKNPRKGNIRIVKTLTSYNIDLKGAEFVFSIQGVKDGKTIYSDVILLRFDGTESVRDYYVYDLPVGTEVTVEEVYFGSCYKLLSENPQTKPVVANDGPNEELDPIEFAFTNSPDDEIPKGTSVRNSFNHQGNGNYNGFRYDTDSTKERNQPTGKGE